MYIVKLPSGKYLNLAAVECVEFEFTHKPTPTPIVKIYWNSEGGGANIYRDADAQAIIEALDALAQMDKITDVDISNANKRT